VSDSSPRLRDHRVLLAIAISGPVLETVLLWAFGPTATLALAPQATAPFGTFHDVRWLLVFTRSWPGLVLSVLAFVAVRSLLTALMVRAAWPAGATRPTLRGLLPWSALFTAICSLVLVLWAGLLAAMAVVSVSWLFFASVPPVLVIALLVHHGAVTPRWWRQRPPPRSAGWIALTFVVLTLAGAAMHTSPPVLRVPVAAAAGLFDAWAWLGVVHAVAGREASARFVPIAPVGILVLVGGAIGGAALAFGIVTRAGTVHRAQGSASPSFGRPVLVASGFDSTWDGTASRHLPSRFREERFSYRGLAPDGDPLPYVASDTHASLAVLVRRMRIQVEELHQRTGKPVAIVAESEGSLVAKVYVTSTPDAPVDDLVLLSPLVEPARMYYPVRGQQGWGLPTRYVLGAFVGLLHHISPIDITPDTPFMRSVVDHAPSLRGVLSCPVPGVRQLAMSPLADAVASPHEPRRGIQFRVVPAFHGGLLGNATAERLVAVQLDGGSVPRFAGWSSLERVLRAGGAAWQVPVLPIGVNPAWEPLPSPSCTAIARRLATWTGGTAGASG